MPLLELEPNLSFNFVAGGYLGGLFWSPLLRHGNRNLSGALGTWAGDKWLWLKIQDPGLRRCASTFPFSRLPFWAPIFEPQPNYLFRVVPLGVERGKAHVLFLSRTFVGGCLQGSR